MILFMFELLTMTNKSSLDSPNEMGDVNKIKSSNDNGNTQLKVMQSWYCLGMLLQENSLERYMF